MDRDSRPPATFKPNNSKAWLSLFGFGLRRAFLQGDGHDTEHVVPWRRFAGPYLKLTRRLMNEHFDARNDLNATRLRQFHQPRLRRVVNHLENVTCVGFVFLQWRLARVAHADRSRVDDDVKRKFFQVGTLDGPRTSLPREFLRWSGTSVQDEDLTAAFL